MCAVENVILNVNERKITMRKINISIRIKTNINIGKLLNNLKGVVLFLKSILSIFNENAMQNTF